MAVCISESEMLVPPCRTSGTGISFVNCRKVFKSRRAFPSVRMRSAPAARFAQQLAPLPGRDQRRLLALLRARFRARVRATGFPFRRRTNVASALSRADLCGPGGRRWRAVAASSRHTVIQAAHDRHYFEPGHAGMGIIFHRRLRVAAILRVQARARVHPEPQQQLERTSGRFFALL